MDKLLFHMTFSGEAFSGNRKNARLLSEYTAKLLSKTGCEKHIEEFLFPLPGAGTEKGDISFSARENERKEIFLALEIPSGPGRDGDKATLTIPADCKTL